MKLLNAPIVWNWTSWSSFRELRLINIDKNAEGTYRCECYPRDVEEESTEEKPNFINILFKTYKNPNTKKYKEKIVILVEKGCLKIYPKGTYSPNRDLYILETPDIQQTDLNQLSKKSKMFGFIKSFIKEKNEYKEYYELEIKKFKKWKKFIDDSTEIDVEIKEILMRRLDEISKLTPQEKEKNKTEVS